jgi:putative toxin-antitoxin system antitoxin component (TIGR02293 family)
MEAAMSASLSSAAAPAVSDRLASYALHGATTAAYWLSPMERSQRVKQGVPAREVVTLADAMGLPRDQFMRVLGLARSTVERKITQRGPLSQFEGEKLVGIERLIGQVDAMVREAGSAPDNFDAARWFARWMADPVPALGGLAPQDLLDTADGREAVSTLLYQMKSGVYA